MHSESRHMATCATITSSLPPLRVFFRPPLLLHRYRTIRIRIKETVPHGTVYCARRVQPFSNLCLLYSSRSLAARLRSLVDCCRWWRRPYAHISNTTDSDGCRAGDATYCTDRTRSHLVPLLTYCNLILRPAEIGRSSHCPVGQLPNPLLLHNGSLGSLGLHTVSSPSSAGSTVGCQSHVRRSEMITHQHVDSKPSWSPLNYY
jgi:hypothetical protein